MITNPIIPLIIFIPLLIGIFILSFIQNKKIAIDDIIILILILLINIRPMIVNEDDKVLKNNLDVLFVVDSSISMAANDYNNKTRLEGVKELSEEIIKELNGAKFSLIEFDSSTRVTLPFINDANTALEAIQDIIVEDELYARGTTLNTPLEDMVKMLKSSQKKEDRRRILFFISDGEITNEDTLKSFTEIKDYLSDGAVLGFGTKEGSTMRLENRYTGDYDYVYDYSQGFEKAISRIDEDNLKQIANDINIDYIHVTDKNDCKQKIKDIQKLIETEFSDETASSNTDIYYLFAIPLFLTILFKFYRFRRNIL